MEKVAISAVIIAKNEQHRLPGCLDSLRWVDDIVVVDDFSCDNTVDIAKEFGARVFQRKLDIEGRHRNWAVKQAKYDWVLIIDADERVSPLLASKISSLAKNGFKDYEERNIYGFDIPMRIYIGNVRVFYKGWNPAYQTRLFNRNYIWWAEEEVHANLLCRRDVDIFREKIDVNDGYIIHFSYKDFSDLLAKVNRQTQLEVEKRMRAGRIKNGFYWWRRSISHFLKSYFIKGGCSAGLVGFYISFCDGLYQLLTYFKIKEKQVLDKLKGEKIIFLDRDGVINEFPGKGRYVTDWSEFRFIPEAVEALKRLSQAGYKIFIVSNQAGVGRGIYSKQQLDQITLKMLSYLRGQAIEIERVFYCTHRPEENCPCRKPKTQFFDEVLSKYNGIDLGSVYMVGDSEKDILAGKNAGIKTALILGGATQASQVKDWIFQPDGIYNNLLDFVERELALN